LEKLSLGKNVTLSYGGRRMDCNGRLLAHLHLPDGAWLQGAFLTQCMARVYSFPDNRAVIVEMLEREKAAQAKNSASGGTRFITFASNPNWSRI
jgi:endonuclease YncB( thermonuclease family)